MTWWEMTRVLGRVFLLILTGRWWKGRACFRCCKPESWMVGCFEHFLYQWLEVCYSVTVILSLWMSMCVPSKRWYSVSSHDSLPYVYFNMNHTCAMWWFRMMECKAYWYARFRFVQPTCLIVCVPEKCLHGLPVDTTIPVFVWMRCWRTVWSGRCCIQRFWCGTCATAWSSSVAMRLPWIVIIQDDIHRNCSEYRDEYTARLLWIMAWPSSMDATLLWIAPA